MGFLIDKNNTCLEGYLSDEASFNGVLFLLREPNSDGAKTDKFWFKECLENPIKRTRTFKRIFNRFNAMLKNYADNRDLKNCAFANINNMGGYSKIGENYNKANKKGIALDKINTCNAKIVFTCSDIFNALLEVAEASFDGVEYNNGKKMRKFALNDVMMYEILHPSRSPKLKNE